MIYSLAVKSLRNRKFSAALTVLSISLSVMLLLGVERIRSESRESFTATISGTDLVVGARSSPVHLLLYSVFRIGNPTNNVRWDSYRAIADRPEVAWTIPLSLGDSHRGYRVVGTDHNYFEHFRFARSRALDFAQGREFEEEHDTVLGSEVARKLGYRIGDDIVIAHGAGQVSFMLHEELPFRVAGILAPTGTPVDRTVHVPLEGLDAVHAEVSSEGIHDPLMAALRGAPETETEHPGEEHEDVHGHEHYGASEGDEGGHTISAFLIGLKSRAAALGMQRFVNQYAGEPMTAILPGATLQEVWEIVGAAEKTLFAVSALVVVVGLAGMLVALLTSLSERRREMAILRSVGARPMHVFSLILGEAAFLTGLGVAIGVAGLYAGLLIGQSWIEARLGLFITIGWPSAYELQLMCVVAVAGVLIGLIPAWRIYRYSLADGMTVRI
ncbi:MAG: ABC transporter permease [Betaproteobacteria bacterium]|nr:MAG: ABC transporter permease [Betaproteobacteria bacterium]